MTLGEVLEEAGSALGAIDRRDANGGVEFLVGGRPFAASTGESAEFCLEPVVARAALGTPDARPSSRGPDWVAFRPRELDRFARDRAAAWFQSAWRRARG
jgi:hypothetical protein